LANELRTQQRGTQLGIVALDFDTGIDRLVHPTILISNAFIQSILNCGVKRSTMSNEKLCGSVGVAS
jgi:hypothetical protein